MVREILEDSVAPGIRLRWTEDAVHPQMLRVSTGRGLVTGVARD